MKKRILLITGLVFGFISAFQIYSDQTNELKASMERGKEIYLANCVTCHMANGQGVPNVFPPLAKSDYLMEDLDRSVKQILYGAQGEMKVNGVVYNGIMTGFDLSDKEVADLLNYIRNSWGNKGEIVKPNQVEKAK
ncbi:MAG: cytochrome c [Fulvivirga sp.]